MNRHQYIIRFAVLISCGLDDPTVPDSEWHEAAEFLRVIGIKHPVTEDSLREMAAAAGT